MSWGHPFINFNGEFIQGFHIDTIAAFHCQHCCQEDYVHIHLDNVCVNSVLCKVSKSSLSGSYHFTCVRTDDRWETDLLISSRLPRLSPGRRVATVRAELPSPAPAGGKGSGRGQEGWGQARHVPLHRTPWLFLTQEQWVIQWYGSAPYWMVIVGVTTIIITQSTHTWLSYFWGGTMWT